MKREADADSKRPAKLPKFEEEDPSVSLSLDGINDHCILEIFKCLSVEEDLNSVAVFISKRYNELRNHDSLDQTRIGTIICTENTTLESIRDAFVSQRWKRVFTGNRTRLKVVGQERMPAIRNKVERSADCLLPNVLCLDISVIPRAQGGTEHISSHQNVRAFAFMLPNLEEIDISYTTSKELSLCYIISACRKIRRIKGNSCCGLINMSGGPLAWISDILTEVSLDNSQLISTLLRNTADAYENAHQSNFLFNACKSLERLSMKNVSWSSRYEDGEGGPVSQAMLIKMVRNHPTLRWLRSDLTQENIAMLQQERPDITFVT